MEVSGIARCAGAEVSGVPGTTNEFHSVTRNARYFRAGEASAPGTPADAQRALAWI
jgi:hypothetical protein